jgi:hypothetical protein
VKKTLSNTALTVLLAAAAMLAFAPSQRAVAGVIVISFAGFGSSTETGAPCADLTCNGGDTCDCTSGSVKGPADEDGHLFRRASVNYELSVDQTVTLNDGTSTGECRPATGTGVITLTDTSTIDFVMSGLVCTVPAVSPNGLFNGTLRLTGGTAHHGGLRGLGSIRIGDIGDATTPSGLSTTTTEVVVKVDASGGFQ